MLNMDKETVMERLGPTLKAVSELTGLTLEASEELLHNLAKQHIFVLDSRALRFAVANGPQTIRMLDMLDTLKAMADALGDVANNNFDDGLTDPDNES